MVGDQLKGVHIGVSQSYQQLQVRFNRIYEERVRAQHPEIAVHPMCDVLTIVRSLRRN